MIFDILINNKKSKYLWITRSKARTSVLSLKLTELEIIYEELEEEPILLLDDFMSELDENRRNNLVKQ